MRRSVYALCWVFSCLKIRNSTAELNKIKMAASSIDGVVIFSDSEEEQENSKSERKKLVDLYAIDSEDTDSSTENEGVPLVDLNKAKKKQKQKPLKLRKESDKEKMSRGRKRMIWTVMGCMCLGVLVLLVMVELWIKMQKAGEANLVVGSDTIANRTSTQVVVPATSLEENTHTAEPAKPMGVVADRVDCHPDPGPLQTRCNQRHCSWDPENVPNCCYPNNIGYKQMGKERNGEILLKKSGNPSPFSPDIQNVKLRFEHLGTEGILHFKIFDRDRPRYEVPIELWPYGKPKPTSRDKRSVTLWVPKVETKTFAFQIYRNSSGAVLWHTKQEGFVFSDQFLQIATRVNSDNFYGFGENSHQTLKHNFSTYKTWSLFAWGGNPFWKNETFRNLYGVHPFYICIEPDGKSHGVLFLNSNAQEYTTGPSNLLIYRSIGGIMDFYLFPGPSPSDVIRQYWMLIGRPFLPPYWALGFQLSRYGYTNTDSVKEAIERTRHYAIPQDVQYLDIDYMDGKRDFTVDPTNFGDLPTYVKEQQLGGLRWVPILDPAISAGPRPGGDYDTFIRGRDMNVYTTWPEDAMVPAVNSQYETTKGTKIMLGTVWPEASVAFPDFLRPNTLIWWQNEVKMFRDDSLNFDGLWIDMNEPSNFHTNHEHPKQYTWYKTSSSALVCPRSQWESPPYKTGAVFQHKDENASKLSFFTLCMVGNHFSANKSYRHYDVHNIYGHTEAKATFAAVQKATGKRGLILSRSTFISSGRYTAHWLGDNHAYWEDMRASIIGMLEFSMFGIPMVGADICGFGLNTTEELCLRWSQLGAFYPFSRNHNSIHALDQDPGVWPTVAAAAKKALEFRYYHLPYLYTLFYQAHIFGKSVLNPLIFEFSLDTLAADVDQQFLWGSCLLVTPVLHEKAKDVKGYFPNSTWYSLYETNYSRSIVGPAFVKLLAPFTSMVPVHVKEGCIIPRQAPGNNTAFSRKNPLELLIAINRGDHAIGYLFWDDGEQTIKDKLRWMRWYIKFAYERTKSREQVLNQLKIDILNSAIPPVDMPSLDIIEIFGLKKEPNFKSFRLNGVMVTGLGKKIYNKVSQRMLIEAPGLLQFSQLPKGSVLQWSDITN